jgi:hypothetical protein
VQGLVLWPTPYTYITLSNDYKQRPLLGNIPNAPMDWVENGVFFAVRAVVCARNNEYRNRNGVFYAVCAWML